MHVCVHGGQRLILGVVPKVLSIFKIYFNLCVCVYMLQMCGGQKKASVYPAALTGIKGSTEPPHMGVGN